MAQFCIHKARGDVTNLVVLVVILCAHLYALLDEHLAELGRPLALAQVLTHVVVHLVRRVDVEQEGHEGRHCNPSRSSKPLSYIVHN